jgi:preprotein translocase subunit SecG
MYQALIIFHVLFALGIVGLVMMQQGRGADAGAAFGGGASGTVFGAQGAASFLTRATAVLAVLFFSSSLLLAIMASSTPEESVDLMDTPDQIERRDGDLPPVIEESITVDESSELPQEIPAAKTEERVQEEPVDRDPASPPAGVPGDNQNPTEQMIQEERVDEAVETIVPPAAVDQPANGSAEGGENQ